MYPQDEFYSATQRYKHVLWMSDPKEAAPAASDGCEYHAVGWNEVPVDLPKDAIDAAVLSGRLARRRDALPPILRELPSLRRLAPGDLFHALDPLLTPRLTELVLSNTGDVALNPGPWPELRVLRASDARVSLHADGLPALEKLEMLSKGPKVLAEVALLPRLRGLLIGPIKNASALDPLAALALEVLILKRGFIDDLRGLKHWPKLTSFGAIACYKLADLSPLAALPELVELRFSECSALKKVDALLELPKLKFLRLWGCRDNGVLRAVSKKLRGRGVDVRSDLDP